MCGIVGAVNWGDTSTLEQMTDILVHRGPDDRGVWETRAVNGDWVGLGVRRLSILDLSPAGHMPMSTPDGKFTIIYNGECYNYPKLRRDLEGRGYRFRSSGDTEAILYAYQEYGPECVHRLNGMFAIAIWDAERQQLFLARDHFGIKPLYYCVQGRQFAFASEIKALRKLPDFPKDISYPALRQFLTFLWVPEPETIFKHVAKLPAGSYATYRDGQLQITEYWDLRFQKNGSPENYIEADLVHDVRQAFFASVKSQMLSDVPLGAFLSAGVDSSSVVAAMAHITLAPIRTFTIGFPKEDIKGEVTMDDPAVARRMAESQGCIHQEILVKPDVVNLLPKLVYHMDEPVADPAIITAYLVNREARRHVTVLLSGVGGDEVFAGYRKYRAHYLAEYYQRLPQAVRKSLLEPMVLGLPSFRGSGMKGYVRLAKKMARSGSLQPRERFIMDSVYFQPDQLMELCTPEVLQEMGTGDPCQRHLKHFQRTEGMDFLDQMLYVDCKTFMPSLNLLYNDKMSMASSVEVRVPFLDWEFTQWVAQNVPPQLKLNHSVTKYILRQAFQPLVPPEVLQQRKAGFSTPVDKWLAHDLHSLVDDLLNESRLRRRGIFKPAAVHQLISEHRKGSEDWSLQIWALLTLELWMQEFQD